MKYEHFIITMSLWSIMLYLLKISKSVTLNLIKGGLLKNGKSLQHKILIVSVGYILIRVLIYSFLFRIFINIVWNIYFK